MRNPGVKARVGILKDWLSRTLSAVLEREENAVTLKFKDLERHAWSLEQWMIMLSEAKEEEKKLAHRVGIQSELRAALGLELAVAHAQGSQVAKPEAAESKPVGTRKGKSVGKPLPKRRPVGEGQYGN